MSDKYSKTNSPESNKGTQGKANKTNSPENKKGTQGSANSSKTDTPKITAGQVIKGFIGYYKPYKLIFFVDLICAIIVACVDLAFPQFLRFCTNDFFTRDAQQILDALLIIAIILIVMYLIKTAAQYFITKWGHYMGAFMEADMRRDLFAQYQRLSFSYFDKNNSGDMMSRIVTDLFDISELAHHGPENILIGSLKIVGSFVLLFMLNPYLSGIMLVFTIIMVIWSCYLNFKRRTVFTKNREKMADMNVQIQDSLGGIKTVKSFGNEHREIKKFKSINDLFINTKKESYNFMAIFFATNTVFSAVLYIVTLVGGGYFVATGTLAVNELAIFAIYIGIFIAPIEMLIMFTETFQKGYAGFRRFMETLAICPDVDDLPGAIDIPKETKMNIEYDDVVFSYHDDEDSAKYRKRFHDDIVLNHFNLKVKQGQKVALVGPSGMGKSTTCSLLPRFYDVDEGSVKIGGRDVKDYTLSSLRDTIGIVQQDIYMFNATIEQNIAYARSDATHDEIVEAAKKACIHDFIMSLPETYNTKVGERGTRLSGGQKQRIAIARLFLRSPKIIVLDEATSALDNENEAEVQKSLQTLCQGRTTIVIAHRLSTIKAVDKIAVVDRGKVAEWGTHDELMKLDGVYAKYYNMQFKHKN